MKTRKKVLSLFLVLLLVVCMAPAAFAELVFSGDQENISGEYDSTVFLAGEKPSSAADVKGILFAVGNAVTSVGSSEYAFMAGNAVTLSGSNSNDAFIGGNAISVTGSVGRDLAMAGNSAEIRGSVGRDLMIGARSVLITGHVGGDVIISAEQITITNEAEIEGRLRYNSSAKISAPADLLARADVYEDTWNEDEGLSVSLGVPGLSSAAPAESADTPAVSAETPDASAETPDESADAPAPSPETPAVSNNKPAAEEKKQSPLVSKLKSAVFRFIGVLLIAYFFLWLTPLWEKVDADYTGKPFGKFAKAFGIGLAVLAALPLASIILMVSGVGMRPALVLLFVAIAAMIAAPMFLGFFLGALLWRKALKKKQNYWAELAIGIALWTILIAVPGISFFVRLIAACLGLGVLTLMLGKKKKNVPHEAVPSPVPAEPAPVMSTPAAEPVPPILPPRDASPALEVADETAK